MAPAIRTARRREQAIERRFDEIVYRHFSALLRLAEKNGREELATLACLLVMAVDRARQGGADAQQDLRHAYRFLEQRGREVNRERRGNVVPIFEARR